MECGDRVALRFTVLDTQNRPAREGETGMVIGHRGDDPIVSLDGDERRVVEFGARAFRKIVRPPYRRDR